MGCYNTTKGVLSLKTGLVLEGGGMRGIYTAGVLDAFFDERISFDGVIGVSAGAVHGCSFVSGQRGRSIRYFTKYCRDPRFMSVLSLLTTGSAVGRRFCYHEIPDRLDPFDHEAFEASGVAFYVSVTNLETGAAEYMRLDNLRDTVDCVRASASMPYVSRVVDVGGAKYLDGGIADGIPLDAFETLGFRKNVVVLTHETDFERGRNDIPALNWRYRRYPKFLQALRSLPERYEQQQRDVEDAVRAGRAFCIRPSVRPRVGHIERDPAKLRALYDLGRADALGAMPALKAFLSSNACAQAAPAQDIRQ